MTEDVEKTGQGRRFSMSVRHQIFLALNLLWTCFTVVSLAVITVIILRGGALGES